MTHCVETTKKGRQKKQVVSGTDRQYKYIDLIEDAIKSLHNRRGSSKVAIFSFILDKYDVAISRNKFDQHLKVALKNGVKKGLLAQVTGVGASGSFRVVPKWKRPKLPPKTPKPKKKTVTLQGPKPFKAVVKKRRKRLQKGELRKSKKKKKSQSAIVFPNPDNEDVVAEESGIPEVAGSNPSV